MRDVSIIFDGTTHLGEELVVALRYSDDEWNIQQRLVTVKTLAKCMQGEEIARELLEVLSVQWSISSSRLSGAMRDRASVNSVAMRTLKIIFPKLVDIGCFFAYIEPGRRALRYPPHIVCPQCKSSS